MIFKKWAELAKRNVFNLGQIWNNGYVVRTDSYNRLLNNHQILLNIQIFFHKKYCDHIHKL